MTDPMQELAVPAASAVASPPVANPATAEADELVVAPQEGDERDSSFGDEDDWHSDTTSLASSIVKGRLENGRKYQSLREGEYWGPSDDKQFETMALSHLMYMILDSQQPNNLFHSPIGPNPQNILDIGTGDGTWAVEVADMFPSATVYGVDLYPPPAPWVPPNCIFQVDDVTREWTFRTKFDMIHMRELIGAFSPTELDKVYQSIYDNLQPGGWFEQLEADVRILSDDGSIKEDNVLAQWGPNFLACGERMGRPINAQETMRASFEKAGFTNIQEKLYKCPIGGWAKHKIYKDAGRVSKEHWKAGLEGWAMYLLTKFGAPQPWLPEEVLVYCAQMRQALDDRSVHGYHLTRRVWAQKPLE
ncbi:hypothetical protein BP6252_07255 [Coleophoma cylindrospora]|uniref:S-adenosyl-L-methionine-dependent methyltransferase n=1 Tax=Coleophoma cylindrospora TaxID=1849047 RepID=A0A3D8RHE3_9HELO|nr:hypothetical protein BP6252_07255 [Coleophoma cylindrospora]